MIVGVPKETVPPPGRIIVDPKVFVSVTPLPVISSCELIAILLSTSMTPLQLEMLFVCKFVMSPF